MARLAPTTVDLLIETLANAFWYKRGLLDFLRRCGCAQLDLDQAEQEGAKYKIIRWLVNRYEQSDRGHDLLRSIGVEICRKSMFSDLTPEQTIQCRKRQDILKSLLGEPVSAPKHRDTPQESSIRPIDVIAGQRIGELKKLSESLIELCSQLGTAAAGTEFEIWINQLAFASGLESRGKYTAGGREFDGSICVDADVYLIEAKFRSDKADAAEISNLRDKVSGHADGALGLFISMAGFTSNAIQNASRAGTPLVLLHSQHLFAALGGAITLGELIRKSRRHAKETGCPLLDV